LHHEFFQGRATSCGKALQNITSGSIHGAILGDGDFFLIDCSYEIMERRSIILKNSDGK
jgi:hypothetical protein